MSVEPASSATAYLTKPNIIHPRSELGTAAGEASVVAAEVAARTHIGQVQGSTTVSGGAIQRGR